MGSPILCLPESASSIFRMTLYKLKAGLWHMQELPATVLGRSFGRSGHFKLVASQYLTFFFFFLILRRLFAVEVYPGG